MFPLIPLSKLACEYIRDVEYVKRTEIMAGGVWHYITPIIFTAFAPFGRGSRRSGGGFE